MPTLEDLRYLQSQHWQRKQMITATRIMEFYMKLNGKVYISFSGGIDSVVLLHIARRMYPDIEAVFVNTGLEYPEIQSFVKTFDNVTILRPEMSFVEVVSKYGYPMISKEVAGNVYFARKAIASGNYNTIRELKLNGSCPTTSNKKSRYNCPKYKPLLDVDFIIGSKCCDVMKKRPLHKFYKVSGKAPITAQMADESYLRQTQWLRSGCNMFDSSIPISNPMSFWTKQDVLEYLLYYNIPYCKVYGQIKRKDNTEELTTTGCSRTGCIFCGFGCHRESSPSRFERLKETHPRQYEYLTGGGYYDDNKIWKPDKYGLGMKHVFDELNRLYGEGFIKY